MLRSLSAMFCFIAVSAIPTARDAPARTATEVKAAEVKALNDQIVDVVSKQLQARDEEAKKVAALAAEEDAKLEAMAAKIANKIANHNVAARDGQCNCVCTSTDGRGSTRSFEATSKAGCTDAACKADCGMPCDPNQNLGTVTVYKAGECTSTDVPGPSPPPGSAPAPGPGPTPSGGSSGCFAKDSTTACLLASPAAECEHVLMSDLAVGDLVLGREGATAVVAVQHKAVDTIAEMLTFHTAGGGVSMTPDHAVFADGELVAAAQVKVGSLLSTGAVKRIAKSEAAIINAVTASGTIVADGVLAASNPMWIASLTVDAPIARAVVNAALYAAGDVDTVAAGFGGVLAKIAATAVVAALAIRSRKASA